MYAPSESCLRSPELNLHVPPGFKKNGDITALHHRSQWEWIRSSPNDGMRRPSVRRAAGILRYFKKSDLDFIRHNRTFALLQNECRVQNDFPGDGGSAKFALQPLLKSAYSYFFRIVGCPGHSISGHMIFHIRRVDMPNADLDLPIKLEQMYCRSSIVDFF